MGHAGTEHVQCAPKELGEQLVDNREERKRSAVIAVPCIACFREMDYYSQTPCGRHALRPGGKDGIKQVRQHLHPRATRAFEQFLWDAIAALCFVVCEAPQAATHFVERDCIPQPPGMPIQ